MELRRKKKNFLVDLIFSKFFLLICVVLFFVIVFALGKGTIKNYKVDSEIEDLKAEISELEKQNQEYNQLISFLNSSAFIEQEAKLKLGYKKPGEQVVIIPGIENKKAESEGFEQQIEKLSNPQKWWLYFFN